MILELMKLQNKRFAFYISFYAFITIFAIVGLVFNVKTMPLNTEIRNLNQAIKQAEDKNKRLLFEMTSKSSLAKIDEIARHKLNMRRPNKIIYLNLNR
ncbi:MAG: cell division protein FtsL [Candidatus Marinamargulisbacteria bacterium]|jgi:cell division protein FtsL